MGIKAGEPQLQSRRPMTTAATDWLVNRDTYGGSSCRPLLREDIEGPAITEPDHAHQFRALSADAVTIAFGFSVVAGGFKVGGYPQNETVATLSVAMCVSCCTANI
jgi:hypothetical protein